MASSSYLYSHRPSTPVQYRDNISSNLRYSGVSQQPSSYLNRPTTSYLSNNSNINSNNFNFNRESSTNLGSTLNFSNDYRRSPLNNSNLNSNAINQNNSYGSYRSQSKPVNMSVSSLYSSIKDFSRGVDDLFGTDRKYRDNINSNYYDRQPQQQSLSSLKQSILQNRSNNQESYGQSDRMTSSLYSTPMKSKQFNNTSSGFFRRSFDNDYNSTDYTVRDTYSGSNYDFDSTNSKDFYDTPLTSYKRFSSQKDNISSSLYTPKKLNFGSTNSGSFRQSNDYLGNSLKSTSQSYGILPPNRTGKKYTLVLDLDETLTHTISAYGPKIRFLKRPGLQEFLNEMSLYFEIVIFTAAMQEYADEIIDKIDPQGKISHRLYRQHLKTFNGDYIKDLSILGRDLSTTIIIDNLKSNFVAQPRNGYEIAEFRGQNFDTTLRRLGRSLIQMVEEQVDVRNFVVRA